MTRRTSTSPRKATRRSDLTAAKPTPKAIRFGFDGIEGEYDGFTYGESWNGFPVVYVKGTEARRLLGAFAVDAVREACRTLKMEEADARTIDFTQTRQERTALATAYYEQSVNDLAAMILTYEADNSRSGRADGLIGLDGYTPTII